MWRNPLCPIPEKGREKNLVESEICPKTECVIITLHEQSEIRQEELKFTVLMKGAGECFSE